MDGWAGGWMVFQRLCLPWVQKQYFGIPRPAVQQFVKTCVICACKTPQMSVATVKPIISPGFMRRGQIDLIDMTVIMLTILPNSISCGLSIGRSQWKWPDVLLKMSSVLLVSHLYYSMTMGKNFAIR